LALLTYVIISWKTHDDFLVTKNVSRTG